MSVASCWEMAIKVSLGKLTLDSPIDQFMPAQMAAQALVDELAFVSRDPIFRRYGVKRLW